MDHQGKPWTLMDDIGLHSLIAVLRVRRICFFQQCAQVKCLECLRGSLPETSYIKVPSTWDSNKNSLRVGELFLALLMVTNFRPALVGRMAHLRIVSRQETLYAKVDAMNEACLEGFPFVREGDSFLVNFYALRERILASSVSKPREPQPDPLFTPAQQQRLEQLKIGWRSARQSGTAWSAEEQAELAALLEVESRFWATLLAEMTAE